MKKGFYPLLLLVLALLLMAEDSALGLLISDPMPADSAVLGDTKNGIVFSWQTDFIAQDFNFEIWQMNGLEKAPVFLALIEEPTFELTSSLVVGEYFWQITGTDKDSGNRVVSSVWSFYCQTWAEAYLDSTGLLLLMISPGEFSMKWTRMLVASNANIRLIFEEICLINEKGEILPAIWGFKQEGHSIAWQTGEWQMFFQRPMIPQEFELWVKVIAGCNVSAGDYRAVIKAHLLFEED